MLKVNLINKNTRLISSSLFKLNSKRFYSSNDTSNTTIGFIGLGQMGYHMANNVYKKSGQKMVLYDTNEAILAKFIEGKDKVKVVKNAQQVAEEANVIITMLPASKHVQSVYLGENGLLKGIRPGSVFIDSSTIDIHVSKEVADIVSKKNCTMVDAPVSGGVLGAEAGTLTFMVGSQTTSDFELVKSYLEYMGKNIVYCGSNGNGQVAKICNNMLLGIGMIGTSEAMNLGQKLGMDPKLLASILNTSSGRCWSSDTYNPCPGVHPNVPASKDYNGGFGVSLMAKDMGLAVDAANSVKANVMLGSISHQLYNRVSKTEGFENKDFSSIFKWMGGEPSDKKE
ncbi:3-hydroxyisobutyrate dehydrogenase [Neoconidiobolus thromboides FSU 785]|nr:3-hydroxyisobutyrate dehydrogenase [Neoconidiobolus thromboides FSU 785]